MNPLLVFSVLAIMCLESTAHPSCEYREQILSSIDSVLTDQLMKCQRKHVIVADEVNVKLMNGNVPTEGRVEIEINGVWGTVCNNQFDDSDAAVICSMMGFCREGAKAVCNSGFGDGVGPIYFSELECTGEESSLVDCPRNPIGVSACCHSQDVGVICQPLPVRLVDGADPSEGRVEIYTDGTWGTIDDTDFDELDAGVICAMLDFSRDGATVDTDVTEGAGDIKISQLECVGDEDSILQCPHEVMFSSDHSHDVGVHCQTD